jgi:hypothetical protein
LEIIEGHDTRLSALSINDEIVKDADKLFRFDQVGFGIDVERFQVDRNFHLNWLEEQIDLWYFTASGKELARREVTRLRQ